MKSPLFLAVLLGSAFVLPACNGSDEEAPPPTAAFVFPAKPGYTSAESITVRGTASDNEAVSSVVVNGVMADSIDNYDTWTAVVPLEWGGNVLSVDVRDNEGNTAVAAAELSITRRLEIERPFGYEVDTSSNTLYFVDMDALKIMSVELATGEIAIAANLDQFEPTGASPRLPLDLALDLQNNRIFLAVRDDQAVGASSVGVWAYDMQAESWAAFSDSTIDSNAVLDNPSDLILDSANNRLLAISYGTSELVSVNLATGAQTVLASNTVPDNAFGFISEPVDAVLDSAGNRLLLLDRAASAILSIDLNSGAKSLLTGQGAGSGTHLSQALAITIDAASNRAFVFTRSSGRIHAVDLATGARSVFSENHSANDYLYLVDARSLAIAANELLVFGNNMDYLLAIDLTTEQRRLITNNGFPRGESPPDVNSLHSIAGDLYAHTYTSIGRIAADNSFEVLAGSLTDGNAALNIYQLALDQTASEAYAQNLELINGNWFSVIEAYDLSDGSSSVLSSATVPDVNNAMGIAEDILYDSGNNQLLVLEHDRILTVDTANGSRSILVDASAAMFSGARDFTLDSQNNRALVVEHNSEHLYSVDLNSGVSSAFATTAVAGESLPVAPQLVAADTAGNIWMFDAEYRINRIDAQTGERSVLVDLSSYTDAFGRYVLELLPRGEYILAKTGSGLLQIDTQNGEVIKVYSIPSSSSNNT